MRYLAVALFCAFIGCVRIPRDVRESVETLWDAAPSVSHYYVRGVEGNPLLTDEEKERALRLWEAFFETIKRLHNRVEELR